MKMVASTAVVLLLLAFPRAAFALAEEAFGNGPVANQPDWAEGVVDVVNLKSRVYSQWVNGNENFFYRGDAPALSEALRKYAAVKDDVRQLILLPGLGKTQTFGGKPIPFDWQFHVPSGIYKAVSKRKHAVMTVYIGAAKPRPLEPKQVEQLLQDLNSETFKTREKANQELQKLGHDAKPFLRAALKVQAALEARRRIEALLERLRDFDVSDLEIPKGIIVITVDDLLAAGLKQLQDPDRDVRSMAIQDLRGLAPYSDQVVPALADMLKNDKDDHVRRVAAACLARVGAKAKSAMAILKKGLDDPDAYIRNACQNALEQIDNAKDTAAQQERLQRELAIVKEINDFKKAAGGSK
jgi:hypothetical protein